MSSLSSPGAARTAALFPCDAGDANGVWRTAQQSRAYRPCQQGKFPRTESPFLRYSHGYVHKGRPPRVALRIYERDPRVPSHDSLSCRLGLFECLSKPRLAGEMIDWRTARRRRAYLRRVLRERVRAFAFPRGLGFNIMALVTPSLWRLRAIALATLIMVADLACNSSAPTLTQGPRLAKDQTLRVLLDDQPRSLDPGQTQYAYETAVLRAISEPLLKPTADMNGVGPATAQSFDVSGNGTVFVFHLRSAAQYWDGVPVKAQDFVYAWQRLIDPRLAAPSEPFFAVAVLNGDKVANLDPQRDAARLDAALGTLGLAATDDSTFQVTLARPDPAFVWLAAMPAGAPIRKDVVAKSGDSKWASAPESLVTNGPFKVAEMVANDHLKVVPNTHYWGARPALTAINFVVVNDGAVALTKYRNGELDQIDVQPAQAVAVTGDAKLAKDLLTTPSLSVFWITFRVNSPPLNNSKVRLAIAEAIDRNAFVARAFEGEGMPAETLIPKGLRGYAPGIGAPQKFDLAQARASLAASGMTSAQLSGVRFAYDQSNDFAKVTAA